jgi:hypothetical protein
MQTNTHSNVGFLFIRFKRKSSDEHLTLNTGERLMATRTLKYRVHYHDDQSDRYLQFTKVPQATADRICELYNSNQQAWLDFILSCIAGPSGQVEWNDAVQNEFDFWMNA